MPRRKYKQLLTRNELKLLTLERLPEGPADDETTAASNTELLPDLDCKRGLDPTSEFSLQFARPSSMDSRQISDVGAPNLIGPVHAHPTQQIGVNLMAFGSLTGVGFLIDRHEAHQSYQTPDPL